jgi:hypothetical protein
MLPQRAEKPRCGSVLRVLPERLGNARMFERY